MTVLATGLFGEQIEKFFVATGTGGNGKSLLNSQMMETVGDYGYKLGANVLLDEIKEGANPAIANLNRKRFVLCQEPNGKKRICTATVKEITGDKQINARQLYSGECKTNLTLTLVMECNELPQLDEVGGGVQRRLEAILFDSRFVDKDTYDSLKDKSLLGIANTLYKTAEFQAQHRQALFMILLTHWEKFQKNG
jgi:putative DNA primase/helicase